MEKQYVVAQMTGQQEVVADVFASVLPQLARVGGAVQQLFDGKGGPLHGMAQQPGIFVGDLQRDPADMAGDENLVPKGG
jgi:hypothetical protein